MRKLAHIINPFIVGEKSDLFFAQPITFETMRVARQFAAGQVEVELFTTQYPEDHAVVPRDFRMTPDLERSVLDLGRFTIKRKLPLIKDILDRLYAASEAEYLIFTNNDIALMPYFYASVNAFIAAGYDAFAINRRIVSDEYRTLAEIPLMYAETGRKHEGHDCFVFRREHYPRYRLGNICVGMPLIGRALVWNLFCFARRFKEFKRRHLTFHLGDPVMKWQKGGQADFVAHNQNELRRCLLELEQACGVEQVRRMLALYPEDFDFGQYDVKDSNVN